MLPGLVLGPAFKAGGASRERRYGGFDSRALPLFLALLIWAAVGCAHRGAQPRAEPASGGPAKPDTSAATPGHADTEAHAETELTSITIVALPDGRIRLASSEEMSDGEFLTSFASSERLARVRAAGREMVIFVEQAEGVSLERAYELVAKIKIPGVLAATRLR